MAAKSKSKVLRVHYNFDLSGGAEYDILKLLKVFNERGYDHRLILIERIKNEYHFKESTSSESASFRSLHDLERYVMEFIRLHAFTIIHLHSLPYPEVIDVFFRIGLPVYKSMHDAMMVCPGWGKFWLTDETPCSKPYGIHCLIHAYTKKCTRSRKPEKVLDSYQYVHYEIHEAANSYKQILVYSSYMKSQALAVGIPEEKISHIPSPQFEADDRPDDKDEVNKPERLLFVGRLSKQKGLHYLLEAMALLKKRGIHIELDVIGDGQNREEFMRMAETLGLSGTVFFYGWVSRSQVKDYYRKAIALIIPSVYPDNFPNVVAEAMINRKVVITFDSGGTAEWFEDGISGFKVPSKGIHALAEKIEFVLNHADLKTIGENARQHLLKTHHPDRVFERYQQLYS